MVHFLTDVYGFDELALNPSPPRRCIPETRAARHGLDAVPETVAKIEAEAEGLSTCLAKLPESRAALAALSPRAPAKLTAAAEALASFTTQHRAYADQVRAAQAAVVADLAPKAAAGKRSGAKVAPKYRDSATGDTWSGRGLQPTWLRQALASGKDISEFAI